jgi:hypothetical protein
LGALGVPGFPMRHPAYVPASTRIVPPVGMVSTACCKVAQGFADDPALLSLP